MENRMHLIAAFVAFGVCAVACTDAKPVAPSAREASPKKPATPPPFSPPTEPQAKPTEPEDTGTGSPEDTGPLEVDCDPEKDFAKLEYPQDVQDCLKQDKLYNFDAKGCTTMGKALWECSYASIKAEITNLTLSTSPLDKQQNAGAKLIGCGASNDGTKIIAQYFVKNASTSTKDCKFLNKGKVISVCFQQFVDVAPPVPTTDAEKKAYVASCMTE